VLFAAAVYAAGQKPAETLQVRAAPPAIELTFERFVPEEAPEEPPAPEMPAPEPLPPEPEAPKVMTAEESPVTVEVPPEPEPEEVRKEPEPEPEPEPVKPPEAVKPPEVTPPPPEVKKPPKKAPAPVKKPIREPKPEKAAPQTPAVTGEGAAPQSKSTVDIAGDSARAKTKNEIVTLLAGLVDKAKRYPKSARRAAQEGTVEVAFTVSASGRVLSAAIVKGCEFEALNDASADAADKVVGTELHIPNAGLKVIVPIRYRLN
jgi:protein TonB